MLETFTTAIPFMDELSYQRIFFWLIFLCFFFLAGGMVLFSVVINSFVHIIMYSYYFAALFGPAVQRKLEGIKKNITLIQMVISKFSISIFKFLNDNFLLVSVWIFADPVHHYSDSMCFVTCTRLRCTEITIRHLCTECFTHFLHVLWFL